MGDLVTAARAKYEDDAEDAGDGAVMCAKRPPLNSIKEIVLSGIGLASIGDGFADAMQSVRVLDLSGNALTSWSDVGAIISGLSQLVSLDVSRNPGLGGGAGSMGLKALCPSLKILQLNSTGAAWPLIADSVTNLPGLVELGLSSNGLGDVPADLPCSPAVSILWLGENSVESWASLQVGLPSSSSSSQSALLN